MIKKNTNIQDVLYRKELIDAVNDNIRNISLVLLALAVVLTFISFALINNTIRLAIYSKRFLIHTMKLVGRVGDSSEDHSSERMYGAEYWQPLLPIPY